MEVKVSTDEIDSESLSMNPAQSHALFRGQLPWLHSAALKKAVERRRFSHRMGAFPLVIILVNAHTHTLLASGRILSHLPQAQGVAHLKSKSAILPNALPRSKSGGNWKQK